MLPANKSLLPQGPVLHLDRPDKAKSLTHSISSTPTQQLPLPDAPTTDPHSEQASLNTLSK